MSKIQQSMKKAQAGLVKSSKIRSGFAVPFRPGSVIRNMQSLGSGYTGY
jgi:hypothetical protein